MTYSESAKGKIITQERAIQELASHGITCTVDIDDFFDCLGRKEYYKATDVLNWLGY